MSLLLTIGGIYYVYKYIDSGSKSVAESLGNWLAKLATEAFIKQVCLATAKHLASKSSNKLDDELVAVIEDVLN
ncbi:hypothetical protein CWC29_014535 [Pseudoalteromonas sp. S4498]|nr:hypothetical protein [Pseudoalteromonas galatheae]